MKWINYHHNKIDNMDLMMIVSKHKNEIDSKEAFYYWLRYKFNKLKKKEVSTRISAIFIFLNSIF
jgi:hypothetical protein